MGAVALELLEKALKALNLANFKASWVGRGLLGRVGLAPGEGMLLDASPSVHMFFMRFPIDVVFLDRDRRVVAVKHCLRPWRVTGARRAVAALELPAGTAAAVGVEEGDVLVVEDV